MFQNIGISSTWCYLLFSQYVWKVTKENLFIENDRFVDNEKKKKSESLIVTGCFPGKMVIVSTARRGSSLEI